jgi:hypothetical protein
LHVDADSHAESPGDEATKSRNPKRSSCFRVFVAAVGCVMPTRTQQLGLVILLIAFAAFLLFRLRG